MQTVIPLPGNGAMRLTTARYYTPSGRSIQGLGITPDIEVASSRNEEPALRAGTRGRPQPRAAQHRRHAAGIRRRRAPTCRPIAKDIPKLPPEGAPAFDPTKPDTDFQLQQALLVVRAMPPVTKHAALP